jgi:hypothetical protein
LERRASAVEQCGGWCTPSLFLSRMRVGAVNWACALPPFAARNK